MNAKLWRSLWRVKPIDTEKIMRINAPLFSKWLVGLNHQRVAFSLFMPIYLLRSRAKQEDTKNLLLSLKLLEETKVSSFQEIQYFNIDGCILNLNFLNIYIK